MKNVVNKFEEAYNIAKAKKDAQSMIRVAENYVDIFKEKQPQADPYGALPTDVQYEDISKSVEAGEKDLIAPELPNKPAGDFDELDTDPAIAASIQELVTYPGLPKK